MAKKIALSDRYPKCVSKYSEKTHERDSGNPIGVDKLVYRKKLVILCCFLVF